ncbi:MAG: FMN-binding protein [Lachnospiraceae bacterium]|nr:FMN-binding protein [Lachnospiraceae bacterium]
MRQWKKALVLAAVMLVLAGCGKTQEKTVLQDGTFTAQMMEYSHGWREFLTITVKNGVIVTAEYNAENAAGFIKSWDNAYMNNMKSVTGTYPNEYTRYYATQLKGMSELPDIDALTGATSSGNNFKRLSEAVFEKAAGGDTAIAWLESLEQEDE